MVVIALNVLPLPLQGNVLALINCEGYTRAGPSVVYCDRYNHKTSTKVSVRLSES